MRSIWFKLTMVLVALFFCTLSNVNAEVKENAFTNEECITDEAWKNDAKTEYTFNKDKEIYELSGISYDEYVNSDQKTKYYIFYTVTSDGRNLTAYVPKYNEVLKENGVDNILYKHGIIATDDCDYSYKVTKTIVGASKESEKAEESNNQTGDQEKVDKNSNQDEDEELVPKVETPNTASPLQISVIVIGTLFLVVAIYLVLKKYGILPDWRKK